MAIRGERKQSEATPIQSDVVAASPRRVSPVIVVVVFGGMLALLLVGFLAIPFFLSAPPIALPNDVSGLDPAVVALIEERVARVEEEPRDAARHGDLGLVYEANTMWEEARVSFGNAMLLDRSEMLWQYHFARATQETGDVERAREMYRKLADDNSRSAFLQQRLGAALLENGELAAAEMAYRRIVQLEPELPHGYVGLGEVLLEQRRTAEAAAELEKARSIAPDYSVARYLLGRAYRDLGRIEEAESELALGVGAVPAFLTDPLEEKLQSYAVNFTARLDQAGALLRSGDASGAVAVLEALRKQRPANVLVLNNLSVAYMRQGRFAEADRVLRRAASLDQNHFPTFLNLATLAMRSDRPELSVAYADSALRIAPKEDQIHLARAQALGRLGRYREALESATEAVSLDAGKAQNHAFLGDVYVRLDRQNEAQQQYRAALAIDPVLFPALIGFARTSWAIGEREEAERTLETARSILPDHPLVMQLSRQFTSPR